MDLKNLAPGTRRLVLAAWTLGFGALYFVVLPAALLLWSESRSWPPWDTLSGAVVGVGLVATGLALVGYCSHVFSRLGGGSIVPIDPNRKLVLAGPYRYSRNPLFVGYLAILLGLSLATGAVVLFAYTLAFFLYPRIFVYMEERDLTRRFGDALRRCVSGVPGVDAALARRSPLMDAPQALPARECPRCSS